MAYAFSPSDFISHARSEPGCGRIARGMKQSLPRRVIQRIFAGRQAQADRDISRYLERTGGRLTDDVERRITRHLMTGDWTIRD
jgi:hypothetical protein